MADYVPLRQAAQEAGIHPATIYRYIKLGKLHPGRREMDRRTYIDREELGRLLEVRPVEEPG